MVGMTWCCRGAATSRERHWPVAESTAARGAVALVVAQPMLSAVTVEIDHVKLLVVVGRPVWVKRRSVGMPLIGCSRWLR